MDPIQESRCAECGREFLFLGDGPPPARCEDCVPETGPGSRVLEQIAINLRSLRARAGLSREELARRAAVGVDAVGRIESVSTEPRVTTALRLSHTVGASLDQLAERIYWNPGEVAPRRGERRPPSERLAGFFSVVPANVPVFEPPLAEVAVGDRREAAVIVGRNIRAARERRHLTQAELARGAGLSKAGLSLIERGAHETTINTLLSLARCLEVTPDHLLSGISWKPATACASRTRGRAKGHAGGSLDGAVTELWNEGRTAREIAGHLGASPGTISAIVHRLRERGEPLAYRSAPTRSVHRSARLRRARCSLAAPRKEPPSADPVQDLPSEISDRQIAACVGTNVRDRRRGLALTQLQLAEAAEVDRSYVNQIERGRHVLSLSLLVRLAASLNVRCECVAAGVVWESSSGSFRRSPMPLGPGAPRERLGGNVAEARRRLGISQQHLADRASINRSEMGALERGTQNVRVFSLIRVAGALGIEARELFARVGDWHVRPLPAPEYPVGERPPTRSEREAELEMLWRDGRLEREIAETLGWTPATVAAAVRELRDAGRDLPYRRPARGALEVGARKRRRRR
jgi:transcriptional regulator with XRE-family HTH domain